jgi:hypothetical protein
MSALKHVWRARLPVVAVGAIAIVVGIAAVAPASGGSTDYATDLKLRPVITKNLDDSFFETP